MHRLGEAHRLHRLDEVVDRALLEGLHRVLLVGGDEHDVRAPPDLPRCFDAVHARHVDV
jgi:hypothetical protein